MARDSTRNWTFVIQVIHVCNVQQIEVHYKIYNVVNAHKYKLDEKLNARKTRDIPILQPLPDLPNAPSHLTQSLGFGESDVVQSCTEGG
jgi:hypothetical protein